jgi:hypothetical protein
MTNRSHRRIENPSHSVAFEAVSPNGTMRATFIKARGAGTPHQQAEYTEANLSLIHRLSSGNMGGDHIRDDSPFVTPGSTRGPFSSCSATPAGQSGSNI